MAARIKRVARDQMARDGAASLSLGRIAREMGVSTPALYRYFASRDALVHALVRDAYGELADVMTSVAAETRAETFAVRFAALVSGYREWVLAHSQDYVLIHGAIFPGCVVPDELIRPEVARLLGLFVELLAAARAAGTLRTPRAYAAPPEPVRAAITPMSDVLGVEPSLILVAYMSWLPVHALVWEQLRGHSSELFDPAAFFELEMGVIAERLGLA